ncbi:mitomycin antibiotics/polyketide fumonisin biosynthesis protein [Nonomuraea phyllanthi]|uniref:Mitomycin antibiotics/polyketide fumonisin biosynthesis protein n=1 Tax=Nonomuraea phyllanthi TaxID=2219224 RepID=A0A5C4VHH0_9ACTN|nr:mitomycin antibiotics/polyketide fumonisin biosynthesis protein [Nonomuraea phyllanthi]QFY14488.1 mitomycin antibiotics/polyketide fumonisin biosynthesis protein [Nonomuraea phyllanthi]
MIDVEAFVADGFAKVEAVVPREVAEAAQALLWERIGLSPDDPSGWTRPVVWAADLNGEGPFGRIMRSERLAAALDAVAGTGGWVPRDSVGNVPIRFPVSPPADDRGWHIDANTAGPDGAFGVSGRPGTLLVLVLLSQVGPADAPTRVRAGSQRDVAALLDERVRDVMEMGALFERAGAGRPVALATGSPGDVYVVHPFTVHAAQEHRGGRPRFMAQTPVFLTSPLGPGEGTALGRAAGFDRL